MGNAILILFYLLFPALVLYLERNYTCINKIGPVVICYAAGLLIGNTGILPDDVYGLQDTLTTIVVPLAIPLLLFSLDIRKWFGMIGKTFLSLVLGLVSVTGMVLAGFYIYRDAIPEIWKISGMLVGFYSGGAPNVAAIKVALDVDPDVFILTQTYDLAVGAVTLLFLMTVARRFFLLFMRPYPGKDPELSGSHGKLYGNGDLHYEKYESYEGIFKRRLFIPLLGALGLSAMIFAVSGGIGFLFPESARMTVVILAITSLGIAASFVPRIKRIEKSFQSGNYLILVFCVVVASMADISMFSFDSMPLLMYIILAVPGALLLHGVLSRIFNVDVDNFLIISVALSMSPPFVPVVASALRNRNIILPGLVTGIIGYALGNYLGVLVAYALR